MSTIGQNSDKQNKLSLNENHFSVDLNQSSNEELVCFRILIIFINILIIYKFIINWIKKNNFFLFLILNVFRV
jgi:hypothetical protein